MEVEAMKLELTGFGIDPPLTRRPPSWIPSQNSCAMLFTIGDVLLSETRRVAVDVLSRHTVMIIHIWMHWFWITAAYFKGFLLLTAQTISLSCISHPYLAEAKALANDTTTTTTTTTTTPIPITPDPYTEYNSSHLGHEPNITSPVVLEEIHPPKTTSSSPRGEETTEDTPGAGLRPSSDVEDTYNGGSLDSFQYPLKKLSKYSHKYGKTKGKVANVSTADGSGSEPAEGVTPDASTTDLTTVTSDVESATSRGPLETLSNGTSEDVLSNETLVIENKVEESGTFTTVEAFVVRDRIAAATSAQNYEMSGGESEMNVGSITGITLGILVVFSLFGAVSFVLYRRRYLNKPQVLHDKCSNLDSSGYIDETSLRENSEEMYSLDNDSFLNSLEAMTIQNYWTENVKHTKL